MPFGPGEIYHKTELWKETANYCYTSYHVLVAHVKSDDMEVLRLNKLKYKHFILTTVESSFYFSGLHDNLWQIKSKNVWHEKPIILKLMWFFFNNGSEIMSLVRLTCKYFKYLFFFTHQVTSILFFFLKLYHLQKKWN